MSRDRDEAMLFYGPILAWDIIMTHPVTVPPSLQSRDKEKGGKRIKEIESSSASVAKGDSR